LFPVCLPEWSMEWSDGGREDALRRRGRRGGEEERREREEERRGGEEERRGAYDIKILIDRAATCVYFSTHPNSFRCVNTVNLLLLLLFIRP